MSKSLVVVKLWHYPCIMRVVMHRKICYRTEVLQCDTAHPTFDMCGIQQIFGIKKAEDWLTSNIRDWARAKAELATKVRDQAQTCDVDRNGFFITVRPHQKYDSLMIGDLEEHDRIVY